MSWPPQRSAGSFSAREFADPIGAGELVAYETGAREAPVHKAVVLETDGATAAVRVTWFPDGTVSERRVSVRRLSHWSKHHSDAHATLRANAVARRAREQR